MIRVLVLGMSDVIGGVETFLINYYRNIDRTKLQFDFLSYTEIMVYTQEIESLGGRVFNIIGRRKNPLKNHVELSSFFKKHAAEYSAIWCNISGLNNIEILKMAKKYGITKRIIHSHTSKFPFGKLAFFLHIFHQKQVHRLATDFWACSHSAAKYMFPQYIYAQKKYQIINNSIDTNVYKYHAIARQHIRATLHLDNKYVVGHVGRLSYAKNQLFMLETFKVIHEKNPSAVLLIVGDGELRDQIEHKISELKLEDSVILTGTRVDIPDLMQAMDVFLLPSRFEGFPLTLVEAQASGLPCIISDTITNGVKITDLIEFMSLKTVPSEWADKILKYSEGYVRRDTSEQIRVAGYDIKEQAKWLEEFFVKK